MNGTPIPGRNGTQQHAPQPIARMARMAYRLPEEDFPEGVVSESHGSPCKPWEPCDSENHASNASPESHASHGSNAADALAAALPARDVGTDREFRLAVFSLARHLTAVEDLRDQPAGELKALVRQWHDRAARFLSGRSFTDSYSQFVVAWKGVRYAAGDDIVRLAWELSAQQSPPPEAVQYDDARIGRLIGLCRQLQFENDHEGRGCGFCLSGYVAAKLMGVCQRTAAAWLAMLVEDGVLERTAQGGGFRDGRRMAAEYRMTEVPNHQLESSDEV